MNLSSSVGSDCPSDGRAVGGDGHLGGNLCLTDCLDERADSRVFRGGCVGLSLCCGDGSKEKDRGEGEDMKGGGTLAEICQSHLKSLAWRGSLFCQRRRLHPGLCNRRFLSRKSAKNL